MVQDTSIIFRFKNIFSWNCITCKFIFYTKATDKMDNAKNFITLA